PGLFQGSSAPRSAAVLAQGRPTVRQHVAMRTLVVSETFPWPVRSGSAMRIAHVVHALADLGPVPLFAMVDPARTEECAVPAGPPVDKVEVAWRPRSRYGGL